MYTTFGLIRIKQPLASRPTSTTTINGFIFRGLAEASAYQLENGGKRASLRSLLGTNTHCRLAR